MDRFFKRSTLVSEYTQEETKEEPTNLNQNQEQEEEEEPHFIRCTRQEDYDKFRNANRRNDYVPINYINLIISHHFPNGSNIIHDYDTTTKLVKIKIIDILNSIKIFNWEFNREPDMDRIPLIAQNMYETRLIKTILCFNYAFHFR